MRSLKCTHYEFYIFLQIFKYIKSKGSKIFRININGSKLCNQIFNLKTKKEKNLSFKNDKVPQVYYLEHLYYDDDFLYEVLLMQVHNMYYILMKKTILLIK